MRCLTATRLGHWGLEAMTDDIVLIVSELLTNAILHSGTTEIGLVVSVRDGCLTITVRDGMAGHTRPRPCDSEVESGRGLFLVESLARERGGAWGTSDAGATTWCRLALPTGQHP
ncbi:ATP-binding protein [Streptomyces anandii]|uniref:ATP-binding protein n=1 Tax=Streptomyces anandii TaxID=285454 RepID=A0ABW6GZ39_9ACTN